MYVRHHAFSLLALTLLGGLAWSCVENKPDMAGQCVPSCCWATQITGRDGLRHASGAGRSQMAEPAFSDTQAAPPNYVRLALTSRVYDPFVPAAYKDVGEAQETTTSSKLPRRWRAGSRSSRAARLSSAFDCACAYSFWC